LPGKTSGSPRSEKASSRRWPAPPPRWWTHGRERPIACRIGVVGHPVHGPVTTRTNPSTNP
jgi:hypothetical protein